jgi:hypothetical protein
MEQFGLHKKQDYVPYFLLVKKWIGLSQVYVLKNSFLALYNITENSGDFLTVK